MKNKVVELMPMNFGTPDGGIRFSLVGFERDGTVWIQPDDLGIEPEQGNALLDFPQPWLIVDEAHRLVLLHWRAAAELIEPADRRERWLRFAERLFEEYQRICAYDATRYH
jgi:hypothetical protein